MCFQYFPGFGSRSFINMGSTQLLPLGASAAVDQAGLGLGSHMFEGVLLGQKILERPDVMNDIHRQIFVIDRNPI